MKRAVTILALIAVMCTMSFSSCKTAPVTDETFRAIYQKYYSGLILDGADTYTVVSGDTLTRIASSKYDDPYYYPVIMLASRDVVLDQDKIEPGMKLVIPDLQRNLASVTAKASMKGVITDCARIEDQRGRADTAKGLRDHAAKL